MRKSKKLKQKYKRNYKRNTKRKMFDRKMFNRKMFGGNGKLLSQGTHGKIYVDKNNENFVYKIFDKHTMTNCEKLKNEFDIHNDFQMSINNDENMNFYIPECSNFEENDKYCRYKMERIFGLNPEEEVSKYYVINMFDTNDATFPHSNNHGIHTGTNTLSFVFDLNNLSYQIGQLFSKIHFEMNYDGYDCELIYGNVAGRNVLCLIDFDKVSKIQWTLGYSIYRKIDETTVVTKNIDNIDNLVNVLYTSMSSMSLIPLNEILLDNFLKGYETYINPNNILQQQCYDEFSTMIRGEYKYQRSIVM